MFSHDHFLSLGEEVEEIVSTRQTNRSQDFAEEVVEEEVFKSRRRTGKHVDQPEKVAPKVESENEAPFGHKRIRRKESNDNTGKDNSALPENQVTLENSTATLLDEPVEKEIIDEESCTGSLPDDDERLSLPMTDDGWFVAAPASRKNYRKKIEDFDGTDEEKPTHSAKTARVKGLIVRDFIPPAPQTVNRRNGNKRDFKRFRKNHVIRGFTSFTNDGTTLPKIRFISVLPKESERLRELEMRQQELDRENAYADALFDDAGRGGKKGRRGAESIVDMLSQPKRGRKY